MAYFCSHGELLPRCKICSEVQKFMQEADLEEQRIQEEDEYMYDFYLDQDERHLRETQ